MISVVIPTYNEEKVVKDCLKSLLSQKKVICEIIVVDDSKLVDVLGTKAPLPVEVLPFAWSSCKNALEELGARPVLREKDGVKFVTDNENYILDCHWSSITNPILLEQKINNTPGVLENGLFLNMIDIAIVASSDGIRILTD